MEADDEPVVEDADEVDDEPSWRPTRSPEPDREAEPDRAVGHRAVGQPERRASKRVCAEAAEDHRLKYPGACKCLYVDNRLTTSIIDYIDFRQKL